MQDRRNPKSFGNPDEGREKTRALVACFRLNRSTSQAHDLKEAEGTGLEPATGYPAPHYQCGEVNCNFGGVGSYCEGLFQDSHFGSGTRHASAASNIKLRKLFMPERAMSQPKSLIRFFRFTLRSLIGMMIVVCLVSAAIPIWLKPLRTQHAAAVEIERLGGNAFECHGPAYRDDLECRYPKWLQSAFGREMFQTINYASLTGRHVRDKDLCHLRSLPRLEILTIENCHITDDGIANLKQLDLLQSLRIENVPITDQSLKHIACLPKLSYLSLESTNITDDGIADLCRIATLRHLNLSHTAITDRAVAMLASCASIESLSLNGTRITDEGLRALQELKELDEISLDDTAVTDLGLTHLKNCKVLRRIHLDGAKITDSGAEQLKKALPGIDMFR